MSARHIDYLESKPDRNDDVLLHFRNGEHDRCFYIHKDDAPALLAIVNGHDGLARALQGLVLCFTEHLSQEAHEKGVTVETLCPCYSTDIHDARAALAAVDGAK
jgi:hypothetical protein